MLLAMVPAAPPTWKNQRATSCPAPISAMAPYFAGSRLIASAFCRVLGAASSMREPLQGGLGAAVRRHRHPLIDYRRSVPVPGMRSGACREDLARLGR